MTLVSDHVSGLGTPVIDGVVGELRIDTGAGIIKETLVWHAAQQIWVGLERFSMRQVDTVGMSGSNSFGGSWRYPINVEGAGGIDNSFGFQNNHISNARFLCAAGLILQEHLSAFTLPGLVTGAKLALNWWDQAIGDQFLSPPPVNIGVILDTLSDIVHWRFVSTGWQNSPAAIAANGAYYPELYFRDGSLSFRRFTSKYRWVSGPVGALGGSEVSGNQPPSFDSCLIWLCADNIPRENGAFVDLWPNYSGYPDSLQQPDPTKRPILMKNVLNGHSIVRFDGIDNFLQSKFHTQQSQPVTYFFVLKQFAGGPTQQVWFEGGNQVKPLIYRADATDQVDVWAGAGGDVVYHRGSSWPSPYICFSVVLDGASSNIWENKTLKVAADPGGFGITGMTLGAAFDGSLPAQIDVAEVLVYYRNLNNTDRNAVIDYLNAKYALF